MPFLARGSSHSAIMDVKLRLVQFEGKSRQRVGVELTDGGSVVDVSAVDPNIPGDMRSFLRSWDVSLPRAARYEHGGLIYHVQCMQRSHY